MATLVDQTVDYAAMIAKLTAENEALRAAQTKGNGNGFKVSEKGALSVYGLGRFPVTLYRGQWEKLFGKVEAIKAFIEQNKEKLTVKE